MAMNNSKSCWSRSTIFSACRKYRYVLWREWDMTNPSYAMFVGLNPSTADENADDPTIRKCVGFAKRWGYGALCMTNLFAFRSTDPLKMQANPLPIGDDNDRWLQVCAMEAGVIIAAWGIRGPFMNRDREVIKLLPRFSCLKTTKDGHPSHPLYVPYSTAPISFTKV
jgi:hypothetical protein